MKRLTLSLSIGLVAALAACSDDSGSGGSTSTATTSVGGGAPVRPEGGLPLLGSDCDALVPSFCGLPFPSNVYLQDDPSGRNLSGKSVRLGAETFPPNKDGERLAPELFSDHDGFSPGNALLTHLPRAVADGCATPYDIARSLQADSPTVLIEADTLRRVPHWVDLDMSTDNDGEEGRPDRRLFMIRPAERLRDAARYIVAIRGVRNRSGDVIPPSPVFDALRGGYVMSDGSAAEKWTTYARRGLYSDIFGKLALAGVDKTDLQIAWDFTTATRENNTRFMVEMRDAALEAVGDQGPDFEVVNVEEFPTEQDHPELLRRVEVRMTVPLFLTAATSGAPGTELDRLSFDPTTGALAQSGTMQQDVLILVPRSVLGGEPHGLLQNGHGLFGSRFEGRNGYLARTANGQHFIAFATNYFGFDEDSVPLAVETLTGNFEGIKSFTERQIQGMVNQLLAMRMMMGRVATNGVLDSEGNVLVDPAWIDPSVRGYRGDSQGGIMGGTYMAVSTDVTRGLLGEPGMAYSLLLNRSVDWPQYGVLLDIGLDHDPVATQQFLAVLQLAWDRSEPTGFAPYVEREPLPGTPVHHVLMHVARGDHQVSTFAAHLMARAIGARHLRSDDPDKPVWEPIFGLSEVTAPVTDASVLVEYDFGLAPNPAENVPNADGCDPHDRVRDLTPSYEQQGTFFRTGEIVWTCDGACNCDDSLGDPAEEPRCRETFADQCR